MGIQIQAFEQAGLVNRDYPDEYTAFFNGETGPAPEPSWFSFLTEPASVLRSFEIDFNYHVGTNPSDTILSFVNPGGNQECNLILTDTGTVEIVAVDDVNVTTTIVIPSGTWKRDEYVKLRVTFNPLFIQAYDISTPALELNPLELGDMTTAWTPSWMYSKNIIIGAKESGANKIFGTFGFIGDVFVDYFNNQEVNWNMAFENQSGSINNITRTFNPRQDYRPTRLRRFILDTLSEESITLVRQSGSIRDPAKIKSDFTQSFSLPWSKTNNNFFAHSYEVNVTPEIFNIYKRSYATIYDTAGKIIVNGVLMLNSIDQRNKVYNVTVYGDTSSLWETLQERLLSDLSSAFWTTYDHVNSRANIEASWTETAVNLAGQTIPDLFYPIESYSGPNQTPYLPSKQTNNLNFQDFRPSMRVKTLFDQIMKEAGFEFESDFMQTTAFTDLFITLAPLKALSINTESFYLVSASNVGTPVNIATNNESVHTSVFKGYITSETDPDGKFDPVTGLYEVRQSGILDVDFIFFVNAENGVEMTGTPTYEVAVTDTNGARKNIATNGMEIVPLQFIDNGTDLAFGRQIKGRLIVEQGDLIAFTSVITNILTTGGDYLNLQFAFSIVGMSAVFNFNQSRSEAMYGITLTQQQLLSSLTSMFNLVWEATDINKFRIEPFKEWVEQGQPVDWTEKLDQSGLIKNNIDERSRKITYQYEESGDALAVKVKLERGLGANSGVFNPKNTDWLEDDKEINIPIMVPFLQQAGINQVFYPMHYALDDDGLVETINNPHMIGYKVAYNTPEDIQIYDYEFNSFSNHPAVTTLSPYKDIPLANDTKTLEFNLYANIVNHIVGRTAANIFQNIAYQSLFKQYWDPWFNEVYNDKAKVFSGKFNLNAEDARIRLNSNILVKDAVYRISKITYPGNSDNLSKVELIKLIDFDFDQFIAWNCELRVEGVDPETGYITFIDKFGNETFGSKDCCAAVNGLWYAEPDNLNGEFRCITQEAQLSPFSTSGEVFELEPVGYVCMRNPSEVQSQIPIDLVSDYINDGWVMCNADEIVMCKGEAFSVIDQVQLCTFLENDWAPCQDPPWEVCHFGNDFDVTTITQLTTHFCVHGDTWGYCP